MNACRRMVVLVVTAIFCLAPSLGRAQSAPAAERQAIFAWFHSLGYPSLVDKPFVCVSTAQSDSSAFGPPLSPIRYGFLLSDDGPTFTVFYTDLTTIRYRKTRAGVQPQFIVEYKRLLLGAWGNRLVNMLRTEKTAGTAYEQLHLKYLGVPGQLLVLAAACADKGYPLLAEQLYGLSRENIPTYTYQDLVRHATYRQMVSEEMAQAEMWAETVAFDDLTLSRSDLRARFAAIARRYPDSKYGPEAARIASVLTRMIREDRAHKPVPAGEFMDLKGRPRAEELVFRLRDQNGHQREQPGFCNIFDDPRGDNSPAALLKSDGYASVPVLMEHLDDDNLTRSITYGRNFAFSHRLLTVAEVSVILLDRIAGRSFADQFYTGIPTNPTPARTRELIHAWWSEIQSKGARTVLEEGTARGDWDSFKQAYKLVEQYPQAAIGPIVAGLKNAQDSQVRKFLIDAVSKLPSPEATQVLQSELKNEPDLSVQLAAAAHLRMRGEQDAVEQMLAEWNRLDPADKDRERATELADFLVNSRQKRTLDAVAARIGEFPVAVREAAIDAVFRGGQDGVKLADDNAIVEPAREALLARMLLDTEKNLGEARSMGNGLQFTDPRMCDLAGAFLHLIWPDRYAFSLNQSTGELDRQRIRLYNVWASRNGHPMLPVQ